MSGIATYRHTQKAPLGLLVYAVAIGMFLGAWFTDLQSVSLILALVGALILILGSAFQQLTVEDEDDQIAIRFGPLPLFRKSVRYDDITDVEVGRTTFIEGWGIHMSPRGGLVWNLWGRDCVVLKLRNSVLRVGTDDAENLASFVNKRLQTEERE
ncbi:hypothetical protein [Gimesia aquarii]|uniref:Bacterial Pleckstrin homology domain-containing protein n=1 Tax=Gimesia aquarii TaxID=2527964 RepID=A0A517WR23_9PLAN|nr:hypothetical protein [Gimesia aquarii]QDU07699.1 hypothetical protein V202x_10600 [Gimesia aquarii]